MHPPSIEQLTELLRTELTLLWTAHRNVGLDGYMCLFTHNEQVPYRSKEAGVQVWFGPGDIDMAVQETIKYYNGGLLPNSPLQLNPIVHEKREDGTYKAMGSGVIWSSSLCLGIDSLKDDSTERIWDLGVFASNQHRGENDRAGLKIVGFCDEAQPIAADGKTVIGCRDLYDLANISSEQYGSSYMLSGISYLSNNGMFLHPDISAMFPKGALKDQESMEKLVKNASVNVQNVLDAAECFIAYERHHSLYQKFGRNPEDIERNLRFFNLVARDVKLFDATGPMRKDADAMFEFIVPGLIPRGAVTLIGATGGTGKSSLAHQLPPSITSRARKPLPGWGNDWPLRNVKASAFIFRGKTGRRSSMPVPPCSTRKGGPSA